MRVLLIDDSKLVRQYTREILEAQSNIQVEFAENGEIGIQKLESGSRYDLILLDWNMPKLDGPGFLLKSKSLKSEVPPVIMLTTENKPEYINKAISLGAVEYIIKPFTPEILMSKIEIVQSMRAA